MIDTPAARASAFLLDLARGKYDLEIAEANKILGRVGAPWATVAMQALDLFVAVNRSTAPGAVQPDGHGGFVPVTNSRIDPEADGFV